MSQTNCGCGCQENLLMIPVKGFSVAVDAGSIPSPGGPMNGFSVWGELSPVSFGTAGRSTKVQVAGMHGSTVEVVNNTYIAIPESGLYLSSLTGRSASAATMAAGIWLDEEDNWSAYNYNGAASSIFPSLSILRYLSEGTQVSFGFVVNSGTVNFVKGDFGIARIG